MVEFQPRRQSEASVRTAKTDAESSGIYRTSDTSVSE